MMENCTMNLISFTEKEKEEEANLVYLFTILFSFRIHLRALILGFLGFLFNLLVKYYFNENKNYQ